MSSIKRIKNLEKKRSRILNELLNFEAMIPGAYNEVFCKCGKDNCWCHHQNDGHLFRRITWSENGHSMTRAIPENDINWIKKVTENYRIFKERRKQIKKLEIQINELLDDSGKNIIRDTRKQKEYL